MKKRMRRVFNETWSHHAEEGEETWVQFAHRVMPKDGQQFNDIINEDWVYEARGHCFRLTPYANCRIKLSSESARCVPCVLIEPIAEKVKHD